MYITPLYLDIRTNYSCQKFRHFQKIGHCLNIFSIFIYGQQQAGVVTLFLQFWVMKFFNHLGDDHLTFIFYQINRSFHMV